MFTVYQATDDSFNVISDTGEVLAVFQEFCARAQQAELMAYLLNNNMFEHVNGATGYHSIKGRPFGLVDLDEPMVFHNMWDAYEDGLI